MFYNGDDLVNLSWALMQIREELLSAKEIHPQRFADAHHAYGVIKEEFDELWDEIKKKQANQDNELMRKEARQLAAMVVRMMVELL